MTQDLFTGFTESTLGTFANSSETQSCWLLTLELTAKSTVVAPQAFFNRDWPKLVQVGTTILRLFYPITLNCLGISD